ncbi:SH3 domain-containing protein [Streptomyces broussonetiae]|uniref:SH3 domain-containing protein n=1 Tax=Streptomyces broussonetiae TaxID=2686304 RepID=A0A6I6N842_9ACTN|nr:SH3 domain-containing protein [Streptomyces broussonetiae]QHA06809.1 SH3 domain-containing protein [Streptomyces broussonetiae]
MTLRHPLARSLALVAATGALLATALAVPATAGGQGKEHGLGQYKGVVTARDGMWLRDRSDRSSRRVRFVAKGKEVTIYCKMAGGGVLGNQVWYLLTDGTWAWGSARYIRNVGPAPRWC